jgi:hypothetical protein
MEERVFTLNEANRLLPQLEELLTEIKRFRKFLVSIESEIKKASGHAAQSGGSPFGPSYLKTLERVVKTIEQINDMGALVKDLDKGLCDFAHMMDVAWCLCWKLGSRRSAGGMKRAPALRDASRWRKNKT